MKSARIRPDPRPVGYALANLLGFGGVGYYWMGQKEKAWKTWAITVLAGIPTCGLTSFFAFLTAYDAYLLGQRLELGASIAVDDNALPLLDTIFRMPPRLTGGDPGPRKV